MNVLRYFFNSPRHSGSNVGNKYVILYTKSHQAGGGRERIVREREKQWRLIHILLEKTVLLKKSTLSFFTVKIPGSRDRKDVWRSQSIFVELWDFCWLKTTWPSSVLLTLAAHFGLREHPLLSGAASAACSNETTRRPGVHLSTTGCQSVHFSDPSLKWESGKNLSSVHKWRFQIGYL